MSKSRGNIVRATPIHRVLGTDALRYFLLREVVFGQDGSFSYDALVGRYNSDLANGFGNLASRTLAMIHQYREAWCRTPPAIRISPKLATQSTAMCARGLREIRVLEGAGGYLGPDRREWTNLSSSARRGSWRKARMTDRRKQLDDTLYTAAEALRIVTALLSPVIPDSGRENLVAAWIHSARRGRANRGSALGQLARGTIARRSQWQFFRAPMRRLSIERMTASGNRGVWRGSRRVLGKTAPAPTPPPKYPQITIDDFAKVDLRVGIVKEAAAVKGANKLLHLSVDIGEPQPRSIVAGIALHTSPRN